MSARATAHISLQALHHNLETLSQAAGGAKILLPVKANAYGHGLKLVAKVLENHPLLWGFGVASADEAWELLEERIQKPILLLTPTDPLEASRLSARGVHLSVGSSEDLGELQRGAKVQLKINTGMNRLGVRPEGVPELLNEILTRGLALEGIYSHFASADSPDLQDAALQLERFEKIHTALCSRLEPKPLFHLSNSAGVLAFGKRAAFDLIRPGIASYGYAPDPGMTGRLELKPALTLKARIGAFQTVRAGESVSYGGLWTAQRDTLAANVQIGYGDGYPRGATGKAFMRVNGELRPVLGRICMDQCMVDVSGLELKVGDEVEVFGPGDLSASRVASWVDTIDYEILTRLERGRIGRVLLEG
ncbi:MAG: alanine racemase [Pseudopedobacter sp.]|nr:alanine racemase [Deinococcales bacterium]